MAYVPRASAKRTNKQAKSFYFGNVRGVDFRTDDTASFRSPDSVNMYHSDNDVWESHVGFRNYGYEVLGGRFKFDEPIFDIWNFDFIDSYGTNTSRVLIHSGSKVYTWDNYPNEISADEITLIYNGIERSRCKSVIYDNKLMILDGEELYFYDGEIFDSVVNKAYIPTTYVSKDMNYTNSTATSGITDNLAVINTSSENEFRNFLTGKFIESFHQNPSADECITYTLTSTTITGISVTANTLLSAVSYTDGTYIFSYNGSSWSINGNQCSLGTYGIIITGTATSGDRITVAVSGSDNIPTKYFRLSQKGLDPNFIEVKWNSANGNVHTCTKVTTPTTNEQFAYDATNGVIIFGSAPDSPGVTGIDNIFVTARKTEEGYADRINKCRDMIVNNNRLILSANPQYPNVIFWSGANTYNYFGELMYAEQSSATDSRIVALQNLQNSQFITLKEDTLQQGSYAIWSATSLEYTSASDMKMTYTCSESASTLGCIGTNGSMVFVDDNTFLSKEGLYAISRSLSISYERNIESRSTLINKKLKNESLKDVIIEEHSKRMYMLFPNGHCYIADANMRTSTRSSSDTYLNGYAEYEWAYLENIKSGDAFPTCLKTIDEENMFIGMSDGKIMKFYFDEINADGIYPHWTYNFDGEDMKEYVTTPFSWFSAQNRFKRLIRKYNDLYCDTSANTKIDVYYRTENTFFDRAVQYESGNFDFNDMDFSEGKFTFVTKPSVSFVLRKLKSKRFRRIQLKITSSGVNNPVKFKSLLLDAYILTRRLK